MTNFPDVLGTNHSELCKSPLCRRSQKMTNCCSLTLTDRELSTAGGASALLPAAVQREYPRRRHGPRVLQGCHDPLAENLTHHSHPARSRPAGGCGWVRQAVPDAPGFFHRWIQDLPDHSYEVGLVLHGGLKISFERSSAAALSTKLSCHHLFSSVQISQFSQR